MTLYRGNIKQTVLNQAVEVVVATGLCCAVPFQILEVSSLWVDFGNFDGTGNSSSLVTVSLAVQSVTGQKSIGDKGMLAKAKLLAFGDQGAVLAQVVLPYQSTTGDLIVRLDAATAGTILAEAAFVMDVKFQTVKEVEYMRLKAEGY